MESPPVFNGADEQNPRDDCLGDGLKSDAGRICATIEEITNEQTLA